MKKTENIAKKNEWNTEICGNPTMISLLFFLVLYECDAKTDIAAGYC